MLQDSEDEPRILGGENQAESGARHAGTAALGEDGLALHHRVGVRAEALETGENAGRAGVHAEQHLAF